MCYSITGREGVVCSGTQCRLKKKETNLGSLLVCGLDMGGEGLLQDRDRDSGTVERISSFLKKH